MEQFMAMIDGGKVWFFVVFGDGHYQATTPRYMNNELEWVRWFNRFLDFNRTSMNHYL
jgi:hypothetical protein